MRTPAVYVRSVVALVVALVAALAGVLGTTTYAQGSRTGIIRGLVVDAQRAPVPFATVTLTSPALQGARTAGTREDGSYVFGQLPAGEYEIAFEATRLAPARRHATLRLGSSIDLNVTLGDPGTPDNAGSAAGTAARLATPALATELYHDEISALPTPRTVSAITRFAPAVSIAPAGSDQVVINGGLVLDNLFMLNGVDISDPIAGTPQDLYVEDAIAETAVLTSGLTAEYGHFGGGVVNAITRSGGNRFSGSYRANFANPSWSEATPLERCDPAVTVAGCRPAAARPDLLVISHEATLGGFIVKDRAWFFGAGKLAEQSASTLLPLSGVLNTEQVSNQRGEIKLTASIARGHTITFDTAANKTTDDSRPSFAYTADPFAVGKRSVPNYADVVSYRGALGARTLVEGQMSLRRWERRDLASVSAAIVDSPMLARTLTANGAPAQYNAPYFDVSDPEKRNSVQGTGNVTYFLDTTGAGRHEINGGYEFFRSQRVGGTSQSATGYVFDTDFLTQPGSATPVVDANGRFIPLWTPGETLIENWLPTRGATLNVDTQSIFVQDRWAIGDRVSADVGVRQERVRSTATGAFGGIDSMTLSPRLAAAYRVDDRGLHTLRATYGEYAGRYDQTTIGRSTSIGNPDLWLGVYFGPVGQGRSFAAGLNPANYLTLGARFPTANVSVADGLLPPLVRELTASYTLQPADGRGLVQLAYVARDWSRLLEESVAIANGTTHVVRSGFDVGTFTNAIIRNSDIATRQYSALEILGEYSLSRDWKVAGNLTAQLTNDGNDPESAATAVAATGALGHYPEIFTAARHYPDGHLPTFEGSTARLWTIYTSRFGPFGALTLSGLLRAYSGGVYDLAAINQPLSTIQSAKLQAAGYPDAPPTQTIFFGSRGSQSFNGYAVVDLKLTYEIPFVKGVRPWAKLEIYNALNNQSLIAWDTTVVPDSGSPADALGLPTGYRQAASFGKATSALDFPSPFPGQTGGRTWRAALGLRF